MALNIIAQIGDVSPLEYCGGVIVRADDDDHAYLEWIVDPLPEGVSPDEAGDMPLQVYRAPMSPTVGDMAEDLDWVDWDDVCQYADLTDPHTRREISDLREIAAYLMAAADYYGPADLDAYPIGVSAADLITRWDRQRK